MDSDLVSILLRAKLNDVEIDCNQIIDMVWDWRLSQPVSTYTSDPEYEAASDEAEKAFNNIVNITKDYPDIWKNLFDLDCAQGAKLALSNASYYKLGFQDGLRLLLDFQRIGFRK